MSENNNSLTIDKEDENTLSWTDNIERLLDKLRRNCTQFSGYHNYKYQYYKHINKLFRIPIIILSAGNTFCSVGLQSLVDQNLISILTSIVALVTGIISSIELFLNIQNKMEQELSSHKDYYKLSIEIFKILNIERSRRRVDAKSYLDEKYSEYEKLVLKSRPEEHTNLIHDLLSDVEEMYVYDRNAEHPGWVQKNNIAPPISVVKSYFDKFKLPFLVFDQWRDPYKYVLRKQKTNLDNLGRVNQYTIDEYFQNKQREIKQEEKKKIEHDATWFITKPQSFFSPNKARDIANVNDNLNENKPIARVNDNLDKKNPIARVNYNLDENNPQLNIQLEIDVESESESESE